MDSYGNRKTNRLINEKSPYLLQHAYNPVDWYPWGNEAFEKAVAEGKPLFLSIGYSTCHWCHVMERESFEDPEVATLLNKSFVSIKVDREERPDLDQFYMAACQAMTGKGGWPLTVFLTPDKKPFFAGTYFPKHSRYGIFGIVDLLPKLDALWHQDRAQLLHAGGELWTLLQQQGEGTADLKPVGFDLPPVSLIDRACQQLKSAYDHTYGGFGDAPKFPAPHQFMLLLRCWKRTGAADTLLMVVNSLKAMHRGGIFDQLGYGMHRYSVDRQWLVPHFEKMLYDQATVALATLEAYQAVSDPELALFARKIFAYVLQELKSPEGGFFTAEDADTEGEEGTFYVWTPGEIKALLGTEHGQLVAKFFGVTEKGNFENGSSVLHRNFKI
ncbi:MAG TPA: thioredoxin domain-containing protein, partial [Candidatus Limnocylindrales bacterium]|nr:thioredoxin domain-containing protein [Candidatus Limnocylindrales bacterium]